MQFSLSECSSPSEGLINKAAFGAYLKHSHTNSCSETSFLQIVNLVLHGQHQNSIPTILMPEAFSPSRLNSSYAYGMSQKKKKP